MDVRAMRGLLVVAALLLTGCGGGAVDEDLTGTGPSAGGASTGPGDAQVTVHLVRHGETIFNEVGRMQGWSDSPLTPEGQAQADTAGRALADRAFVAAYSSDSGRTQETAHRILASQGADAPELVTMPELREWSFGGFEGQDNDDAWGTVVAAHGYDYADGADLGAVIGGFDRQAELASMVASADPLGLAEDEAALVERIEAGFDAVVDDALSRGGGDVLVVSHGMTIGVMLELLDPDGYTATRFHNLSLSVIDVSGDAVTVRSTNDVEYLDAA